MRAVTRIASSHPGLRPADGPSGRIPPRARTAAALLMCAVTAAGGVVACGDTGSDGGQGKASCVSPFIRSDTRRSPPDPDSPTSFGEVRPGQHLSVRGWYYYGGPCDDTGSGAARPTSAGPVNLSLTTSDHRTAALGTAHPTGSNASFVLSVAVPAQAPAGPASIGDGQGHVIRLDITAP